MNYMSGWSVNRINLVFSNMYRRSYPPTEQLFSPNSILCGRIGETPWGKTSLHQGPDRDSDSKAFHSMEYEKH